MRGELFLGCCQTDILLGLFTRIHGCGATFLLLYVTRWNVNPLSRKYYNFLLSEVRGTSSTLTLRGHSRIFQSFNF